MRNELRRKFLDKISIDNLLDDTTLQGLGEDHKNFIKSRPDLFTEVREYFKVHDYSEVSHNCINYLLTELKSGRNFSPNPEVFKASGTPVFQSSNNASVALRMKYNDRAINEAFTNFQYVLNALFKNNEFPKYKGNIIRSYFKANNINVPNTIQDEWLGNSFYFNGRYGRYGANFLEINYNSYHGIYLNNNNFTTEAYLNSLIQNLDSKLNIDENVKGFLFSHPKVAHEFKKYLDATNSSTSAKIHLKILENIVLEDCYTGIYSNIGYAFLSTNLRSYYYREKDSLKELHPDWSEGKIVEEVLIQMFQSGLDIIGLLPVVGEIADLTNGVIYLVRGDRINAAISLFAVVPVIGSSSTGGRLFIKATKTIDDVKDALPFIKLTNGFIDFGSRGKLAQMIKVIKSVEEAHHIIPWNIRFHDIIQKAAKVGFHMNDILNGIPLKKFRKLTGEGLHGNHPKYDDVVRHLLDKYGDRFPNADPSDVKKYLEEKMIPELIEWINKAEKTDLNLNEYFKQIVKPFYGI